jgi:hypothetical protein
MVGAVSAFAGNRQTGNEIPTQKTGRLRFQFHQARTGGMVHDG